MRKLVKVETTKMQDVCDLCEKDCSNGFHNVCFFCGKQTCLRCSRLMFHARSGSGDLLEFGIKVCHVCEAHTELAEKVQAVLDGANAKLREWVDLWKLAVRKGEKP